MLYNVSAWSIATAYDAAPGPFNPAQPGGTPIDVVDSRYTGAITQVGNDIYMTNTVLNGDRDAVHWLVVDERTDAQQLDLLRHQVREIEGARLRPDEEAEVEAEHRRMANAARLLELSGAALEALGEGEGAALTVLGAVGRPLHELARIDESARPLVETHEQAVALLRDLQNGLSRQADRIDLDPARLVELEERLNRITVEAQAASGNAARAEGLLVAFAARRALDNGTPLGYIEGQLRLRFGQAQPRAVAAIINAAREPITLADLRGGLMDVSTQLTTPPADAGWWDALEHEARELITIRKASTPSPRPQVAMDRALRYIDGGRVSAALAEVERMPGRAVADRWMQYTRRYLEARRALDLIETAAILEPRELRGTEGAAVSQTSPLAP